MTALGYFDKTLSQYQVLNNGTAEEKTDFVIAYQLKSLQYIGPVLMGIGTFILIIACVITLESRDKHAQVIHEESQEIRKRRLLSDDKEQLIERNESADQTSIPTVSLRESRRDSRMSRTSTENTGSPLFARIARPPSFGPAPLAVLEESLNISLRRIVAVYFKLSQLRNGVEAEVFRIPSAISNYERIRVVGKGAFGAAVLYRRREDETLVIIKEISMHQLAATERQLAKNEVEVLSRMEHPHIVSYFDSFEEDGLLLIEMEYADGGTLAQFLMACTDFIAEETISGLFEQICSAVAYLHENNVLHRDLKTANIFLTQEGDVKIGDFGISKLMGADTLSKGATTLVGTPHYLSPEMCEGKPYNEKSDMWAIGCILYETMCLAKAFDADSLPALVNRICKSQYEPVRGPYSNGMKLLVRDLLSLEAASRPKASAALQVR
ncbi:unnamed protein product, partial [Mesorhabditis spiculigera]